LCWVREKVESCGGRKKIEWLLGNLGAMALIDKLAHSKTRALSAEI
jgi:hypothetical protein